MLHHADGGRVLRDAARPGGDAMPWWGWIVAGGILLGGEAVVATDFTLALLGAAALTVGLVGAAGLEGPIWLQWGLFSVLSAGYLLVFKRRLSAPLGPDTPQDRLLGGEVAIVQEEIAPGETGRAELRGTIWTARNRSHEPLQAGTRARVEKTDGLVIQLRSEAELEARARHRKKSPAPSKG